MHSLSAVSQDCSWSLSARFGDFFPFLYVSSRTDRVDVRVLLGFESDRNAKKNSQSRGGGFGILRSKREDPKRHGREEQERKRARERKKNTQIELERNDESDRDGRRDSASRKSGIVLVFPRRVFRYFFFSLQKPISDPMQRHNDRSTDRPTNRLDLSLCQSVDLTLLTQFWLFD